MSRTVLVLGAVAFVVAILRYFMKGWVESLGLPSLVGSFLASVTLVTLVGLVIIFAREGRAAGGSYWRAAAWFAAFAVWCQCLVITGILITARTGAATYYEERIGPGEMMGKHVAMPPVQHALSHGIAGVVVAIVGMILGAPIYLLVRRARSANPSVGH